MDRRLRRLLNKIRDESLRRKVAELVQNPTIEIGGVKYSGLPIESSPASISRHHNYPGGLLEHILSSARIALTLCDCIEKIYHGSVDRDLVISGIILHDLFKTLTYSISDDGTYRMSPLAERIDHLTLITSELIRRGFPIDLIHIVCAHHGSAGPISPKTIEALICHVADVSDSLLNGEILKAAKYLIREVTGETVNVIDVKTALRVIEVKADEGWEGVQKVGIELTSRGEVEGSQNSS